MKQRETIFSDEYIDKINPPKHRVKRPADNIARHYGMDLKKGYEVSPPKPKPEINLARNLEPGDRFERKFSPVRKGKGTQHRDFNRESIAENTLGISMHKKHIPVEDNIKGHKVTAVDLDALKYKNPDRVEKINRYMNSSKIQDIFQMDSNIYYKGLLERNKI